MAGRGSRLRPLTLTVPKPLIPVAGKPIVHRLAESLTKGIGTSFDTIAFVIGDFGSEAEETLHAIAASLGSKAEIFYQDQPKGPAHAIQCAQACLEGPCIVAFADTLFYADFNIDTAFDGLIWVKQVEDPTAYGVVQLDGQRIIEFVEKPETFVSDLAIVGIYYFKDGARLRATINQMIEEDIREKGEYQLTTALRMLNENDTTFGYSTIDEWLDCGNKKSIIQANARVLAHEKGTNDQDYNARFKSSTIIPPCYIGAGVELKQCIIGPYVSIEGDTYVENSIIEQSIIQDHARLIKVNLTESMIGNHAQIKGKQSIVNIGDYSEQEL